MEIKLSSTFTTNFNQYLKIVAYKSINWHAGGIHGFYRDERQRYLLADFFSFVNIRLKCDYYIHDTITFEILNFGHWDLFGICDLKFGIYTIEFRKMSKAG
jgi:hypothetical protein